MMARCSHSPCPMIAAPCQIMNSITDQSSSYRWPTGFGNVHRRMVAQRRCRLRIRLLEKLVRPGRRLVDRHVAEPRVHIGHLTKNTSFTAAQTSKHPTPTPYSTAPSTCVLKYEPASAVPTGICFGKFIAFSVEMVSLMFAINSCPPWFPTALFGSVAPFAFK